MNAFWVYFISGPALAVNLSVIIHYFEVSCKESQIISMQRKWIIFVQLAGL